MNFILLIIAFPEPRKGAWHIPGALKKKKKVIE